MPEKPASKKITKKTTRKTVLKRTGAITNARKAPTPIAANRRSETKKFKVLVVSGVLLLVVFSLSVFIGLSDKGVIVVSKTIAERKANSTPEELELIEDIESQPRTLTPRGGLIPTGRNTTPNARPAQKANASTTASSTEATASSTDGVTDESTDDSTEDGLENSEGTETDESTDG